MSAHPGNAYAEKWTLERTLIALHTIDRYSQSSDYLYLGHALDAAGLYEDVWRKWRRKWRSRYEVIDLMKVIMQRFEVRIFQKMAKKEVPERVGMFALRHHYGWGRDPRDIPFEDDSYIDKEPIREPVAEPQHEPQPPMQTDQPPAPQAETPIHPRPTYGEDFMLLKRLQYNEANPQDQILDPLPYFDGEPLEGFSAIRFDKGYFLNKYLKRN